MAESQLIGPLPLVTLDSGCTVTFEAIDPDTGAAVAGVSIARATIYATNVVNDTSMITRSPLFALEPL